MKHTIKLFRTAAICAAFVSATAIFGSCANGTSTTSSDTTTTSSSTPAAADTMSAPSTTTGSDTASKMPRDTTRKDSM